MIVYRGTVPAEFRGTIVDLETTGLSASMDRVITVGVLHDSTYEVFQASDGRDILEQTRPYLRRLPKPLYAFNKEFEESFLGIELDRELQMRPYERKTEAITISGIVDPLGRHGESVPVEWRTYLETRNKVHLQRIVEHNISDLLDELCLAIVRNSKLSDGAL